MSLDHDGVRGAHAECAWDLFAMTIRSITPNCRLRLRSMKRSLTFLASGRAWAGAVPGRRGPTWYMVAAGWTYQFILELLLGLRLEADTLHLPRAYPRCATGIARLTADDVMVPRRAIPMLDDRRQQAVKVRTRSARFRPVGRSENQSYRKRSS